MPSNRVRGRMLAAMAALGLSATGAHAATLDVTITNNQEDGGLFLTPLYFAFHDGSFDAFDIGSQASPGVELLAEEGDFSLVREERLSVAPTSQGGVLANPDGFAGAPVLDPGETATIRIDVDEANRYFSYLSMVIPSNDTFIANEDSMANEIFDIAGDFVGNQTISIFGGDTWDAGTERNDGEGAAFNTAGGTATDTRAPVTPTGSLNFLLGEETVAGTLINGVPRNNQLLATIQISAVSEVPLPAGAPLILTGLAAFGWIRRKKRR